MLKRLGERLFKFYCHPDFQEDIEGDLEEYYAWNLEEKGERYANRKYLFDAILLFRVSLLKDNWFSRNLMSIAMVKNNLKVAYRNMLRHKFYSLLNLGGLAVSITACILIALFIKDELGYDKHFEHSDRVFRVQTYLKFGDNVFDVLGTPAPMGEALKSDYPEVEETARIRGNFSALISTDNKFFKQRNITYADNSFFDVFSIPLVLGNREHLLDEPRTVVINESTAEKLFGEENPMGKVIELQGFGNVKVTGVFEDLPPNSHFQFQMFRTMLDRDGHNRAVWTSNAFITYLRLNQEDSGPLLEEKFPEIIEKYMAEQFQRFTGQTLEESYKAGNVIKYSLMPLTDIHLHSNKEFELDTNGSIQYVYMFSLIGFFILLIACINFMNMATARASVRAKEVGVRKVLGSRRKQLINQFIFESMLNSFVAFVIAILLTYWTLPYFNELSGKSLVNPIFTAGGLWPYLIIGALMVGLLAGIYPAFVLSKYRPVKVLKGEVSHGKSALWMRNLLVVVQFTASIALIIGSTIVYRQLSFLQNKELGFNKDQVLVVSNAGLLQNNLDAYKNELENDPNVESVSISSFVPATLIYNDHPFLRQDANTSDESVSLQYWNVDYDYANTLGLEVQEGRFFDREFATDSIGVVLNETAVRRFGYANDPIGQKIKPMGRFFGDRNITFTIIGVVKDFHYHSMKSEILPHAFLLRRDVGGMSIRFKADKTKEVLDLADAKWTEMSGGLPFEFDFLDEMFARSFSDENRVRNIFTIFAVLAITVACLGLFGLAAYITEQRKKEIGIRKVLGATIFQLLQLLFRNFTKLVMISALVAIPIAYYFTRDWLADFAYPIVLSPTIFILGAFGTLVIAWLTVGYQSLKAARKNPVDNLRYE